MSFLDWLKLIGHILYPSVIVFCILFGTWRLTAFLVNGFKRLTQKIDGTYHSPQDHLAQPYKSMISKSDIEMLRKRLESDPKWGNLQK
jgi:hypothetical protein